MSGDVTAPAAGASSGAPARRGRPPRISRELIGQATDEIGLADLTVRAVAEHLGVTTAAIYHYVEGRDDLLRLAAERSAGRLQTPVDRGQHWAAWLLEWAHHTRVAFVDDPALLEQFLDGAISSDSIVRSIGSIVEVMVRQGFTPEEALDAFRLVSTCALGAALGDVRDQRAIDAGRPPTSAQVSALAERPTAAAGTGAGDDDDDPATTAALRQFGSVVLGIAALRGEDLEPVAQVLREAEADLSARRSGPASTP